MVTDYIRWCAACHRTMLSSEVAWDVSGMPSCPHCSGSALNLLIWHAIRDVYEDFPERPVLGGLYHPWNTAPTLSLRLYLEPLLSRNIWSRTASPDSQNRQVITKLSVTE